MSSWLGRLFGGEKGQSAAKAEQRAAHTIVRFNSADTWGQLQSPQGWLQELDRLYLALKDLVGTPPGEKDCLIYKEDPGDYGALWAMGGDADHDIGIAIGSMRRLLAAVNRRPIAAALVHEIGHVAMRWDCDPETGSTYLQWPGAIEGLATPIGGYALLANEIVPSHTDVEDGSQDWLTAQDFANDMINQGLYYLGQGGSGQQSVTDGGHTPGAKVVEGAMFDLLFNAFRSYDPLKATFRQYLAARSPAFSRRSDLQKMNDFFIALGRHAGFNLSRYLDAWGFETADIYLASAELPVLDHPRPAFPLPVRYVSGSSV